MSRYIVTDVPVYVDRRIFRVTSTKIAPGINGSDAQKAAKEGRVPLRKVKLGYDVAIRELLTQEMPDGSREQVRIAFMVARLDRTGKLCDIGNYEKLQTVTTADGLLGELWYGAAVVAQPSHKRIASDEFYGRVAAEVERMFRERRRNPPAAASAPEPPIRKSRPACVRPGSVLRVSQPQPVAVPSSGRPKRRVANWLLEIGVAQRVIWAMTLKLPPSTLPEDILKAYARNRYAVSTLLVKPWNGYAVLAWADRNGVVVRALQVGRFYVSGPVSDAEFKTLCDNTAARGWRFERRVDGPAAEAAR